MRKNSLNELIDLLHFYLGFHQLVIEKEVLQKHAETLQVDDPLMTACLVAQSIGVNACIHQVYHSQMLVDRKNAWIVEVKGEYKLLNLPSWRTVYQVIDTNGESSTIRNIVARKWFFNENYYTPFRALILDEESIKHWVSSYPPKSSRWNRWLNWIIRYSGIASLLLLLIYIAKHW